MTGTAGYQAPAEQYLRRAGLGPARLGQLVGEIVAHPQHWSQLVRFTEPERWYQRLELAADYEVWLLSWLPGQHTGFHDHGEAVGSFAVTRGRLSERIAAARGRQARSWSVPAGRIRSFGSQHVHDVRNASAQPAVSIHAYSPPLTAMRRYELTANGLAQVATRQAGRDW